MRQVGYNRKNTDDGKNAINHTCPLKFELSKALIVQPEKR